MKGKLFRERYMGVTNNKNLAKALLIFVNTP